MAITLPTSPAAEQERPRLRLEDPPNILADHADRDQLHAGQEEDRHGERREARRVQPDGELLDR